MRLRRLVSSIFLSMRHLLHAASGISATCRFEPTCSAYAAQAIETHGIFAGLKLVIKRLFKCHPWGKGGLDLVPQLKDFRRI